MNDRRHALSFDVALTVSDFDGAEVFCEARSAEIAAGASANLAEYALGGFDFDLEKVHARIEGMAVGGGDTFTISETHFFTPYKSCALPAAEIVVETGEDEEGLFVDLSTDKPAFFAVCETPGVKGVFDDNCVTLSPDRVKRLRFAAKERLTAEELRGVLNVTHLAEV